MSAADVGGQVLEKVLLVVHRLGPLHPEVMMRVTDGYFRFQRVLGSQSQPFVAGRSHNSYSCDGWANDSTSPCLLLRPLPRVCRRRNGGMGIPARAPKGESGKLPQAINRRAPMRPGSLGPEGGKPAGERP